MKREMGSSIPSSSARPLSRRAATATAWFAWTGAGLFAVSLFWFLYSYLFTFGRVVSSGPVLQPVTINVLLFSAFALHHSLLARTGVKRRLQQYIRPELERSLYTWAASLLFIAVCTLWQPIPGVLYGLEGVWAIAGYGVQAGGILLIARGAAALDALDLAGVRATLLAISGAAPRHVPLETGGPYALVRHPLYLGWALFVFGSPTMTVTRAAFAVVSTAYLAIAIPWEERSLVQVFGTAYEEYRRKVRWRMIPGVY
jgi:protein-S-isoprenylcysteine O-methyltransferase Ste14